MEPQTVQELSDALIQLGGASVVSLGACYNVIRHVYKYVRARQISELLQVNFSRVD